MKIYPKYSVELLRPTGKWNARFPGPYDATEEELRNVLYMVESWRDSTTGKYARWTDNHYVVVTFDEIEEAYNSWDQSELSEEEHYHSVFDWVRDAFADKGGAFHPCRLTAGTRISCMDYYATGGGCVQMVFKFNDEAWFATDFDIIECFDKPYMDIEDDWDKHRMVPSIPCPTWQEVLDYAKENMKDDWDEIEHGITSYLLYINGKWDDQIVLEDE